MPREKPFLVLLLTVVFVALGVLGLLLSLTVLSAQPLPEDAELRLAVSMLLSAGYLVTAYGLYRGARWGWVLATGFTLLDLAGNLLYGTYLALLVDALLLVLLLLTAKHYGVAIFARPSRPATPTPPPSIPVAAAFTVPRSGKRFVRRKRI